MFVLDDGLNPALAVESRIAAKIAMMCMNLHGEAILSCLHKQGGRIDNALSNGPDTKERR